MTTLRAHVYRRPQIPKDPLPWHIDVMAHDAPDGDSRHECEWSATHTEAMQAAHRLLRALHDELIAPVYAERATHPVQVVTA